jgi:phospholipid-translocating P-type ATPase (flippase)
VHSHRYTLLNFFPLQVYEQLDPRRKFANFYFLCVGCLQAVPQISVTGGVPVTFMPLSFVLGVDALTKLYEDWQRRRSDAQTNSQPTRVLSASTGRFHTRRWDEVCTGDIIAVSNREIFPADLLLLAAGGGASSSAHCWVSTKSLDGETDTKLREAPKISAALVPAAAASAVEPSALLTQLRGYLRCELPNGNCNDFAGILYLEPLTGANGGAGRSSEMAVASITENNMLLRGCQLRNTAEVYGLVVNTGSHTKSQFLARGGGSSLSSAAEKVGAMTGRMNRDILGICAMLAGLSILGVILHSVWCSSGGGGRVGGDGDRGLWYLSTSSLCENPLVLLGSYFLLSYTFIPVSLYVSVNLVYTATAFMMAQDIKMYDPSLDQPAEVRTMSLCDELGRISHVLSDKTGTLTANHMRLRRLTLGKVSFGAGAPAAEKTDAGKEKQPLALHYGCKASTAGYVKYSEPPTAQGSSSLYAALDDSSAANEAWQWELRMVMMHLAVNHSVLYEEVGESTELSASSPDELALVAGAEHFGFEFTARDLSVGTVLVRDKRHGLESIAHAVEIIAVFPYVSSRKRMTTLVRLPTVLCPPGAPPTGAVYAFTKGADSVLLERLGRPGTSAAASVINSPVRVAQLRQTLGEWANETLRTLVFACRQVPDNEFQTWHPKYVRAIEDPRERAAQKAGKPNAIEDLQAEIERDLLLQGGSAVEDELQHGVSECLRDLSAAGVRVWMLTGDKVGTAKNIAAACHLLPPTAIQALPDMPLGASTSGSNGGGGTIGGSGGGGRVVPQSVQSPPLIGAVLELTTETVPGLEDVPAAEIASAMAAGAAYAEHLAAAAPRYPSLAQVGPLPAPPPIFSILESKYEALSILTKEIQQAAAVEHLHYGETIDVAQGALSPRLPAEGTHRGGGGASGLIKPGGKRPTGRQLHLIVDEKAIDWLMAVAPQDYAIVALRARAVVACRCRQEQKALMVNLVKERGDNARVLAIGDGANDVAMIKAAHVGVGIAGKEGMQAVQNADFAIGQFRFLRRLMLVHGRSNYRRMALLVVYMFYKNVIDRFAQFVFTNEAGWSGQKYYSEVVTQTFNVVYTSLPIIVIAVTDADVPRFVAERVPVLYRAGVRQSIYTHGYFWSWVLEALVVGFLIYHASVEVFRAQFHRALSSPSVLSLGIICQTTIVTVCNLRLALEVHSWKLIDVGVFALSLFGWVASMLVFSTVRAASALEAGRAGE